MDILEGGFPIGTVLLDRYLIEKEIEAGAMSHVYFSKDQWQTDTAVIVKTPIGKLLNDKWIVKKFKQEAESLARLAHPNIVRLLAHGGFEHKSPFVVLEYVEGKTLTSIMSELSAQPERAAKLFLQIAQAIDFAHSRQIFHRDLKPDNIMIQRAGETDETVKIIDFGIARIGESFFATGVNTRYQVGTPFYLSPNRLLHEPHDRADDIYALGIIAYEMVTGTNPLSSARNFDELRERHEQIMPPFRVNPTLPREVSREIVKALSLNPENRHTSALEFGNLFYGGFFAVEEPLDIEPPPTADIPLPPTDDVLPLPDNTEPPPTFDPSQLVPDDFEIPAEEDFDATNFDETELLAAISAGERFLLGGDYEAAVAFYDDRLAVSGASDLFYSRRAMAFLLNKDYEKAVQDCQEALKINSQNDFAYLLRGILYRLKLWSAEAENELLKAIQINQNNIEASLILGDIYASQGDTEKALSYYAHIVRVNPRFSWAYTNRGNLYYDAQNFTAAAEDFSSAIKFNPSLAWNFYRRAKALIKNGVYEQPLEDLTRAVELEPKNTTFYNERARLLFKIGKHQEALADFNRIKELSARTSFIPDEGSRNSIDKKSGLASLTDYLKWILMGQPVP